MPIIPIKLPNLIKQFQAHDAETRQTVLEVFERGVCETIHLWKEDAIQQEDDQRISQFELLDEAAVIAYQILLYLHDPSESFNFVTPIDKEGA